MIKPRPHDLVLAGVSCMWFCFYSNRGLLGSGGWSSAIKVAVSSFFTKIEGMNPWYKVTIYLHKCLSSKLIKHIKPVIKPEKEF